MRHQTHTVYRQYLIRFPEGTQPRKRPLGKALSPHSVPFTDVKPSYATPANPSSYLTYPTSQLATNSSYAPDSGYDREGFAHGPTFAISGNFPASDVTDADTPSSKFAPHLIATEGNLTTCDYSSTWTDRHILDKTSASHSNLHDRIRFVLLDDFTAVFLNLDG